MRALLLSAGFGTRLRPLTRTSPKCLVPVNGKPLMEYWLDMLIREGIRSILVNLHYLPEKVQAYVSASPYKKYIRTVYEENILGTGGTLLRNRAFFNNEPIVLIHADNLSVFDFKAFVKTHQARPEHCAITMMTFETDSPKRCGIVELNSDKVVRAFHEKVEVPPGRLANGAVYIVEPIVLDFLYSLGKKTIDFSTEVLPRYLGKIYTFHNTTYHRDIGTMESYRQAQKDFKLRL